MEYVYLFKLNEHIILRRNKKKKAKNGILIHKINKLISSNFKCIKKKNQQIIFEFQKIIGNR